MYHLKIASESVVGWWLYVQKMSTYKEKVVIILNC